MQQYENGPFSPLSVLVSISAPTHPTTPAPDRAHFLPLRVRSREREKSRRFERREVVLGERRGDGLEEDHFEMNCSFRYTVLSDGWLFFRTDSVC